YAAGRGATKENAAACGYCCVLRIRSERLIHGIGASLRRKARIGRSEARSDSSRRRDGLQQEAAVLEPLDWQVVVVARKAEVRRAAADIVGFDYSVARYFALNTERVIYGLGHPRPSPRNVANRLSITERRVDHGRPCEVLGECSGLQVVQGGVAVRRTERRRGAETSRRRGHTIASIRIVDARGGA